MNKRDILKLNSVPEGQEPWLSYDDYHRLKRLFEAVPIPTDENAVTDDRYLTLHRFLTQVAGLTLPPNETAIHFNAFTLIRRGYKVEEITPAEYARLRQLMNGLAEPAPDDEDLYETGGHRMLYDYLTQSMGLPVQRGRGPAWHRASALIKRYEAGNLEEK
jgi:hypothetical protein